MAKSSAPASGFDYAALLNESVNDVAKRLNYDADPIESATPMSTGLLTLDLLYGGGIRPGWYTHFGKEQSSKTTSTIAIAASAIKEGVPLISYFDYEASTASSQPYIKSILKTCGVDKTLNEVFGQRDPNSGGWLTPPIVRFFPESIGERFFDYLSAVLRALPDKKKIHGKWWLIYEDTKQNKARIGEFADASMSKKYGRGLWVPADNGELQALFIVDSYPAMNPASNDEDETDNSIALQARMFSKQLPRVKGRLMQKMVAVIGTNQLRDAPMVMYGPKEVEPGGQSLKFNCFGEDTLLYTKYGLISAKEFHALGQHSHLQSIKGMERISGWKCVGYSDTVKVTTDFGYSVTGKPGHKVLVVETGEKMIPLCRWISLRDLMSRGTCYNSQGYFLALSSKVTEKPTDYQRIDYNFAGNGSQLAQVKCTKLELICDENIGELLGWIISEGFAGTYTISISNTNRNNLKRIARLIKNVGFKPKIRETCVEMHDAVFSQWLGSIGCKKLAMHKSIPMIIRMSPASVQRAFLRGLFGGDGSATPRETEYLSISNTLLDQLQTMLMSFGIICKKHSYKATYREHKACLTSEELKISIARLMDPNVPHTNRFMCGSLYFSGRNNTKLRELIGWKTDILVKKNGNNERSNILPELFTNYLRTRKPRVVEWFNANIKRGRKYWRTSYFYENWFADYIAYAQGLRTLQERESFIQLGTQIKHLVDATVKYDIVWQHLNSITAGLKQPCYDACVPDTHTIWTNGIISHNSDCRTKFTPRSSGQPLWPKNFDKETGWEVEKSVEYQGGRDSYRYIQLKTIKNKLSSPNRVGWLRIWADDGAGSARGYDPVFDTLYYLYVTGQLTGRGRKSMKLSLRSTDITPNVQWDQLKQWILGTVNDKKEISAALGYKKPFDLRKYCFTQLKRGIGEKLYIEHSQQANVEEPEGE